MTKASILLYTLVFAFVTWSVYTGGLAASQRLCEQNESENLGPARRIFTGTDSTVYCSNYYRFFWFIMAYQFVTIVAGVLATIIAHGVSHTRILLFALFTISTVLLMLAAETFLAYVSDTVYTDRLVTAYRVTAAGAIMTVVANMLVLIVLGTHMPIDDKPLSIPV